jgi:hypothetical protein
MLRIYKYILKLHHVENGEYSIIHLFSCICTSLKVGYIYIYIYIYNLFECILNMWLIHCAKIKEYPHVDH